MALRWLLKLWSSGSSVLPNFCLKGVRFAGPQRQNVSYRRRNQNADCFDSKVAGALRVPSANVNEFRCVGTWKVLNPKSQNRKSSGSLTHFLIDSVTVTEPGAENLRDTSI